MYAVVKIGGHQYKVSPGNTIDVDRIAGKAGESVSFPSLLVGDGVKTLAGQEAAKTKVLATIVDHKRGEKVNILRFKAKVRYHRRKGFRAGLTTLKIEAIGSKKAVSSKVTRKTVKK